RARRAGERATGALSRARGRGRVHARRRHRSRFRRDSRGGDGPGRDETRCRRRRRDGGPRRRRVADRALRIDVARVALPRRAARGRVAPAKARPATFRANLRMLRTMIYCVIPPELEDSLYEKLVEYYKDNPNVTNTFKNFIGGEWVDAASGETFDTTSPATGEHLGTFPRSSADDVDRAVAAAMEAFRDWRLVPAPERGNILFRFAHLLTEHK